MAKYVVTGNNVSIAGTDVSASVARAELTISSTEVDVTDFASGGFTEVVGVASLRSRRRPKYLQHYTSLEWCYCEGSIITIGE